MLRQRFSLTTGLADNSYAEYILKEYLDKEGKPHEGGEPKEVRAKAHKLLILDPACGTGTFLYSVVDRIREGFMRDGNAGMWPGYVKAHLLPRLFGLELLMAPYAIAHFKMQLELAGHDLPEGERAAWGYDFSGAERLGIYLTSTLAAPDREWQNLFGPLRIISDEARAATTIKRDMPIMVVIGNPPWSGQSANRSWEMVRGKRQLNFIGTLIRDYYQVDGEPLEERNPKWLQDDYVKFIRWAQWRIERTGAGVLGFVTAHGYLDNPTFRGMRQQLMTAFSDIYVLDLHGNAKKKERCPDGSKDENVFDIQQGVCIGVFVKEPGKQGPVRIHHAELWGLRETKYARLLDSDVSSTEWKEFTPTGPFYLFTPEDLRLKAEWESGWKATDIFPTYSVGIATARDRLTIHWTPDEVWDTVRDFASLPVEEARAKYNLGRDARDWKVHLAQQDLNTSGPRRDRITPVLYRPFDVRYTYYTGQTRGFICMPRPEVMGHMLGADNLALVTSRLTKGESFAHVQSARTIVEVICMSPKTSNNGFVFPLYLRRSGKDERGVQKALPGRPAWEPDAEGRTPNLDVNFIAELESRLLMKFEPHGAEGNPSAFGPLDVFHYVYAQLHVPSYRTRYEASLRGDFPRIFVTANKDLFRALCECGKRLVDLQRLELPALSKTAIRYPKPGNSLIGRGYPKFVAPGDPDPATGAPVGAGRVYVNSTQYFEGISPELWEFPVGGYQPCEKWLKDRVGRTLSYEDLAHYQKMVGALEATGSLMAKLDEMVAKWPIG